jgi:hypothetical protein
MTTPSLSIIALSLFAQAPGPIVPTVTHPDLPSQFSERALENGLVGDSIAMACQILAEGVPLCFRVEVDGMRNWFSLAQAQTWGFSLETLAQAVDLDQSSNPFVEKKVPHGGHWWQVEAKDGRESLVFLNPGWLEPVGDLAVVAAPAAGVVIAWQSGDSDNDKIMAVGVRALFDQADAPVSPKIFRHTKGAWTVWGELVPEVEPAKVP